MLRSRGIQHRPGLAAELMTELAPLLAADGIDLDDPNLDVKELQLALNRATEWHNLQLFTPVGRDRERALAVLKRFSLALNDGRQSDAQAELSAIGPEATKHVPSAAHVIGAGLGLIDSFFASHPSERVWLLPAAGNGRPAARDILKRTRSGRAFDALNDLIIGHAGQAVLDGVALVIASCAATLAESADLSVDEAVAEVFASSPEPVSRRAPVNQPTQTGPVQLTRRDRRTLRDIRRWYEKEGSLSGEALDDQMSDLEILLSCFRSVGFDPDRPTDAVAMLEPLADEIGVDEFGFIVDRLHDYLHFRIDTSSSAQAWQAVHDQIVGEDGEPEPDLFTEVAWAVIDAADAIDTEERRAALASTPLIAKIPELLSWIGKGRKITQSGLLRRADIATVGAIYGVTAVGVDRFPTETDAVPGTIYARSMADVPPLMTWWDALKSVDVIEVSGLQVRPGPNAHLFADAATPEERAETIPLAERMNAFPLVSALIQGFRLSAYLDLAPVERLMDLLLLAMAPSIPGWASTELAQIDAITFDPDIWLEEYGSDLTREDALRESVDESLLAMLDHFEELGLLTHDGAEIHIPPALQSMMARALLTTWQVLDSFEDDFDEFDEERGFSEEE